MDITFTPPSKPDDIRDLGNLADLSSEKRSRTLSAAGDRINHNFDVLFQYLRRAIVAVGEGLVDLTTDVTGLLPVGNGGTKKSSFVAYAPIVGGITTTSALQSADTGLSTSGYVFTSNGASTKPSFQTPSSNAAQALARVFQVTP